MALRQHVILSAGHGSGDSGAVAQGTTEANETIQITNRTADQLRAWGVSVDVVPHDVGDLSATIRWINARYAGLEDGLTVEIHKNSGGGNGSEVWCPSYADSTSVQQAQLIANALHASTGEPNRGVKYAQNNRHGRLGITDDTNTYAVLVEAGFIDVNPVDDPADARYAYGIAKGIMDIFGRGIPAPAPVTPPAPAPSAPPAPTTKPVPASEKLPSRKVFKTKLNPTHVWDLTTNPNWKSVKALEQGVPFVAFATIKMGNSLYYVTESSHLAGRKYGVNAVDLEEVVEPAPVPVKDIPVVVTPPPVVVVTPPVTDVETPLEKLEKRVSAIEAFINGLKALLGKS